MYPFPEPGASAVAQFAVPIRGTWNSLAVHAVPDDSLYDSMNVYIRKGKIRGRPGFTALNDDIFNNTIIGSSQVVTSVDKRVLALTKAECYEMFEESNAWVLTKSVEIAQNDDALVDIAFNETAASFYAFIASEGYLLKQWTRESSVEEITASSGAVPEAKSVAVAQRRVICLVPPHTIAWSSINDHTTWPGDAYTKVAQTGDVGICVRALSNLSFAVYKEKSIYLARAQSGNDETAFAFAEPIIVPGPVGIHAICRSPLGDMYMTPSGRILIYDGSRYPYPIADGLWLFMQDDLDPVYMKNTFAVYDERLHVGIFYYPSKDGQGKLDGMIIINFPYEGLDVREAYSPVPIVFKGKSQVAFSHGCSMYFNNQIERSLMFSATQGDKQSFTLDEASTSDDGTYFECMMQTPMKAMPNARHHMVTVESFFERQDGYGFVKVEPVLSDMLESEDGSTPDISYQNINLNKNPVGEQVGFGIPTRFFGLKYTWSSVNIIRYAGAVVYGAAV